MQQPMQVVFEEMPMQGKPTRIIINGQSATTSPITLIQTHPYYPGWIWITTQSGSRYAGQIKQNEYARTIYQQNTTPSSRSLNESYSNTNSQHSASYIPPGLNWGAFLLPVFWSIAHSTWMGLLAFIPGASLIVAILLLIKGNEYAWKNRAFKDVQEFQAVQRAWVIAGVALSLFTLAYYGAIIFAVLMLLCAV